MGNAVLYAVLYADLCFCKSQTGLGVSQTGAFTDIARCGTRSFQDRSFTATVKSVTHQSVIPIQEAEILPHVLRDYSPIVKYAS